VLTTLLLLSATAAWAAAPISVAAAIGCSGTGAWHAAWESRAAAGDHEPEGAKAATFYRNGDACIGIGPGRDPSRSAWVMIMNNPRTKYAQSGYWNAGGPLDCWAHFTEYDSGAGFSRKQGPCTNLNESHTPMVKYIPATGKTELWIDSLRNDVMAACTCTWARPLLVAYSGESHDLGTDMPGYAATKNDFSTMQIQYFTDDTWHGTCGTITLFKNVTNAKYAADAPACNHVRTWTANP
jgi:hypothetical protein